MAVELRSFSGALVLSLEEAPRTASGVIGAQVLLCGGEAYVFRTNVGSVSMFVQCDVASLDGTTLAAEGAERVKDAFRND